MGSLLLAQSPDGHRLSGLCSPPRADARLSPTPRQLASLLLWGLSAGADPQCEVWSSAQQGFYLFIYFYLENPFLRDLSHPAVCQAVLWVKVCLPQGEADSPHLFTIVSL